MQAVCCEPPLGAGKSPPLLERCFQAGSGIAVAPARVNAKMHGATAKKRNVSLFMILSYAPRFIA
jgi:hypothetical protein